MRQMEALMILLVMSEERNIKPRGSSDIYANGMEMILLLTRKTRQSDLSLEEYAAITQQQIATLIHSILNKIMKQKPFFFLCGFSFCVCLIPLSAYKFCFEVPKFVVCKFSVPFLLIFLTYERMHIFQPLLDVNQTQVYSFIHCLYYLDISSTFEDIEIIQVGT